MLVELKNDIEEINRLCDVVKDFCEKNGIEYKYHDVALILDEMVTNVINYAYPDGKPHDFYLEIEKDGDHLNLKLVDSGVAFDPLQQDVADTESDLEDRPIGGLGIFIVKQLSESVAYERKDDKNHLFIKINLKKEDENGSEE